MWPTCVIVRGRPRHPQTQGSIERGNQDVHPMVGKWMKKNASSHWAVGKNKVFYMFVFVLYQ
jgi:hypothetical protein